MVCAVPSRNAAIRCVAGTLCKRALRVLAVALDRGSADKPRKFLADLKVEHLTQAHDPSYASARAVGLIGLPTTLVLDASGREIGRLAGEAEWNSPAVHALLTRNWEKLRPRISALP